MYRPSCIQIALNTGCDIVQPNVEGVTRVNALKQQSRVLHGRIESELEVLNVIICIKDSTRLFNKYYHARANWYDIGLVLGLSSGDLAALEQDHRGDCARCFEGVITKWLRSEGKKTESELSQAVNRRAPQCRLF